MTDAETTETEETLPLIEPVCLSHGTLECRDLTPTRRFYTEFLGVDVIRHAEVAMGTWCGGDWFIACVGAGESATPQPYENRWGLSVETPDEVDEAHAAAKAQSTKYDIQDVLDIEDDGDIRRFSLRDLDGNWWEIHHRRNARLFDDYFADAADGAA